MARTYLSANNSRGNQVTASNSTHCSLNGWTAGVEIYHFDDGGKDGFHVYLTSGSNGSSRRKLGTVTDTPDGPAWTPAGQEAS